MSLFAPAEKEAKRLKMYVFGGSGTGKTVTSLKFPSPVMIDAEKGSDYYGEMFKFQRLQTSDPNLVSQALEELLKDPKDFKTFIIDPFTIVYDKIVDMQATRMKMKTGNPSYTIQPLDYKHIKGAVKQLVYKLLALDMNVIITARSKPLYSSDEGEFMKIIGSTAEGPKELPYMFDIVLELVIDSDGHRVAHVHKDRTNKLPKGNLDRYGHPRFDFTNEAFEECFGEGLTRSASVQVQEENLVKSGERNVEVKYKSQKIKTAGIQADNLKILEEISKDMGEDKLKQKIQEDYSVSSVLDLKNDEASFLISQFENKS
jgi:hypothetical protein